jgi:hypothetical protein
MAGTAWLEEAATEQAQADWHGCQAKRKCSALRRSALDSRSCGATGSASRKAEAGRHSGALTWPHTKGVAVDTCKQLGLHSDCLKAHKIVLRRQKYAVATCSAG